MNSSGNDDQDSADRISSDLAQVEQQLSQPRHYSSSQQRGRAAFESVASALTSLRQRLTRSTTPSQSQSSTPSPPAAAAAAAASAANNNNATSASETSASETSLMERLTSAEMAHSHRIPLQFLEQERERRRSQMTLSSTNAKPDDEYNDEDDQDHNHHGDSMDVDHHEEQDHSDGVDGRPPSPRKADEASASAGSASSSSSTLSRGRRRHASSLMASRTRDEALQQPALERELHNAGIEVVLLSPVAEGDDEQSATDGASLEITTVEGDAKEQPTTKTSPAATTIQTSILDGGDQENQQSDNLSLLLTQQSLSRLPYASSAVLLASTNSMSTPVVDSVIQEHGGLLVGDGRPPFLAQ